MLVAQFITFTGNISTGALQKLYADTYLQSAYTCTGMLVDAQMSYSNDHKIFAGLSPYTQEGEMPGSRTEFIQ